MTSLKHRIFSFQAGLVAELVSPSIPRQEKGLLYLYLEAKFLTVRFLNTVSPVILLNETEMWAQQAALCSRKSEEQLGASQRDRQLQAEGGWAHSTSTVDLLASLLLAGLQFVDHSTNDTFENTDLDCSPFSSVPFHRQELPLNCRAGNLKKKKNHTKSQETVRKSSTPSVHRT